MEKPARSRNHEVARLLETIGEILEIKGELPFKVAAYHRAAARIEGLREPIEKLHAEGRLREIPGVGPALEQKIAEFLTTGRLEFYERLAAEFPPGLVALLEVPGLGPRKARLIFEKLGIEDLEGLERAARSGLLRSLPGLGEKTEENILHELERLKARMTRRQLGRALQTAEELIQDLQPALPPGARLTYAGSLRRMADTIGNIDLLAASNAPERVVQALLALPAVREVLSSGPQRASVLVRGGIQVDLRVVEPASWGAALIYFTGSKEHNVQLRQQAAERGWKLNEHGLFEEATGRLLAGASEEEVYQALGLEFIPPELREATGEIEAAAAGRLPKLIEVADLKGDLHLHSTWSDGSDTLAEMARAARALGYQYMAITDHSPSLAVARGLSVERVHAQRAEIDRLNAELAPFRILHGTELDILRDGQLDYPDEVLAQFDYVSVSIHSHMRQSEETMTARIQRALRNPYVHTLNHPWGRLIPQRPAYAVDMAAVIATAAAEGVALEINSQPERMDLEATWARRAREAGVKLVIDTDAHAAHQLALRRLGVATARRAWLEAGDVLNTLPLDTLLNHLRRCRTH